ncbi:MAG: hypothetical protein V8R55_06880 [Dysosmobacter sp.]
MAPKKIQVIPNGDSLKTKWSRAIRYGDLIFTTANSAALPATAPCPPHLKTRAAAALRACKTRWKAAAPAWTWSCMATASWPTGGLNPG